jgi:hypothetical protein
VLQASVFSLGFGVLFLPAPYFKVDGLRFLAWTGSAVVWAVFGFAMALTFLLPLVVNWLLTRLHQPAGADDGDADDGDADENPADGAPQ